MEKVMLFEAFTKSEIDYLLSNKQTYLHSYDNYNRINNLLNNKELNHIYNEIKNYDTSNFIYQIKPYNIRIISDDKFNDLLNSLNNLSIDVEITYPFILDVSVNKNQYNMFDFTSYNIPLYLLGTGLGYKIYKETAIRMDYLSTNLHTNKIIYSLWLKLIQDNNFYSYTSLNYSGIINKNISDERLHEIIYNLKDLQLIFDKELQDKLNEKQFR